MTVAPTAGWLVLIAPANGRTDSRLKQPINKPALETKKQQVWLIRGSRPAEWVIGASARTCSAGTYHTLFNLSQCQTVRLCHLSRIFDVLHMWKVTRKIDPPKIFKVKLKRPPSNRE